MRLRFGERGLGERELLVRSDFREEVVALGFDVGTPRLAPEGAVTGGRAAMPVYRLSPLGPRVIWKRCRRGGLTGPLWGDRYWLVRRFEDELHATVRARAAGLPVGEIPALAVERQRAGHRVEMLCTYVEGARTLAEILSRRTPPSTSSRAACPTSDDDAHLPELAEVVREVARVLRRFHGAGLLHGDLNTANLLWRSPPTGGGGVEVTIVDLDPGGVGPVAERAGPSGNLLRLWRAVLKGERSGRWRVGATTLYRFLDTYYRHDRHSVREFWRRARRHRHWVRWRHAGRCRGGAGREWRVR